MFRLPAKKTLMRQARYRIALGMSGFDIAVGAPHRCNRRWYNYSELSALIRKPRSQPSKIPAKDKDILIHKELATEVSTAVSPAQNKKKWSEATRKAYSDRMRELAATSRQKASIRLPRLASRGEHWRRTPEARQAQSDFSRELYAKGEHQWQSDEFRAKKSARMSELGAKGLHPSQTKEYRANLSARMSELGAKGLHPLQTTEAREAASKRMRAFRQNPAFRTKRQAYQENLSSDLEIDPTIKHWDCRHCGDMYRTLSGRRTHERSYCLANSKSEVSRKKEKPAGDTIEKDAASEMCSVL